MILVSTVGSSLGFRALGSAGPTVLYSQGNIMMMMMVVKLCKCLLIDLLSHCLNKCTSMYTGTGGLAKVTSKGKAVSFFQTNLISSI